MTLMLGKLLVYNTKKRYNVLCACFFIGLFYGCNTTKFVPEGKYLLDKVNINSDMHEISREELYGYLRQTPNSATLGIWKINLHIYNISGRDSTKWYNRLWRRMGSPPVIYNPSLKDISRTQLELAMQNKGYFNANVSDTVVFKKKKANIYYKIKTQIPYRLRNYSTDFENVQLAQIASDTVRSYIRPDMLFNVDVLENERNRIATFFRQTGHYYFTKDMISFVADSSLNSHQIDLSISLNENLKNAPERFQNTVFRRFKIRNVIFHTNDDLSHNNNDTTQIIPDTIQKGNYLLISRGKSFIRFNTLIINTSIVPNLLYSDFSVDRTYAALNAISAIRYIDMNFSPAGDSLLDCNIYLTPAKQLNFSLETELTYTEGFWGIAGNISSQHKNIFGGGEVLSLRVRTAVERQDKVLAQEYGGQIGLQFPNFLIPFVTENMKRRIRAKTEFSANINYQFRPQEYTMTSLGAGLKYIWNWRQSRSTLDLFDFNYVYFPNISNYFYNKYISTSIYNPHNFEDHSILRLAYGNTFSGYSATRPLRSYISYGWSIETAGNLFYALSKMTAAHKSADNSYRIFNIRYSQYIKGYFSMSYNQIFDQSNRIVYRAGLGIASPYANANVIPYERRFFSGGANSVRGWAENTLGPGAYHRITTYGYRDFNQSGDIKLDLNMEVRSKMLWLLEGALFFDAGNIWTIRSYEQQQGGVFSLKNFYNQIALAYGVGIRADFTYFLLRFDVGVKLYNPALDRRNNWRTSPTFKDDFAIHLAIGYPF